jgi:type IV fimbrial biogenesis protein FimT
MVTILVFGILAALAAPAFSRLIATNNVRAAASSLSMSMLQARSEAARRGQTRDTVFAGTTQYVRVQRVGSSWTQGWELRTPDDVVIAREGPMNHVTILTPAPPAQIDYVSTGRLRGTAQVQFSLKSDKFDTIARCVTIDVSGYANVATGTCA